MYLWFLSSLFYEQTISYSPSTLCVWGMEEGRSRASSVPLGDICLPEFGSLFVKFSTPTLFQKKKKKKKKKKKGRTRDAEF